MPMQTNRLERDTLLVPTDFSDVSDCALDHAIEMARMFGHKICLLHVLGKHGGSKDQSVMKETELAETAAEIAEETGLEISHILEEGNFFSIIKSVAARIRAKFIVMGVHGSRGYERFVSSHAYKVVCEANIPVLVVKHKHHHQGYKNIVIPIDFSQKSIQKIGQAIHFGKYFNACIRVFGFLSDKNKARIIKKEALLKSVNDIFRSEGIQVSTHLLIQPDFDWTDALIHYAEDLNADLIMIVAEKGRRIPDIFSSNATEQILDRVDVPVLTIAPSEAVQEEDLKKNDMLNAFLDPLGLITGSARDIK
jgi:nucleotide-binding universal stress UspA family protein